MKPELRKKLRLCAKAILRLIFQWKCRGLAHRAVKFNKLFGKPRLRSDAMLLQELNNTDRQLSGYIACTSPSIEHTSEFRSREPRTTEKRGQTVIYIDRFSPVPMEHFLVTHE